LAVRSSCDIDPTIRKADMLPNFFVIGAPRSGTTSMYEYLDAHPDVYMSTTKEPDFFADPLWDEVHPLDGDPVERSIRDDAATNDDLRAGLDSYEELFARASNQARIGEASAIYLGHPTAAWHLRSYFPDAKFIVILRNPAERAFSHSVHAKRVYADHGVTSPWGAEGRSVDEEFTRAVDVACREGMPQVTVSEPEIWVRAGYYHAHLTRWFELFDRDRFALFLFEELSSDARAVVQQVYGHLGIDDGFELPTTEAFNASVVPKNQRLFSAFTTTNPLMRKARDLAPPKLHAFAVRTRNKYLGSGKPPVEDDLGLKLASIYREDTERLQDLIGRDLSSWLGTS
jgi:hypothetical protein